MIIQCEQCKTKFKLDDSKVPAKGVKVRCAKCKYVFSVSREQQPDAESTVEFGSRLDAPLPYGQAVDEASSEFAFPEDDSAIEFEETAPTADTASLRPDQDQTAPFAMEEDQDTYFGAGTSSADQEPTAPADGGTFPELKAKAPDSIGEIDFGAFAFGDEDDDSAAVVSPALDFGDTPTIQPPPVSKKADAGGLDFSGDDMFGEVVPSAPEDFHATISFDFGTDDFSASMGAHAGTAGQNSAFTLTDSSPDSPFSLDEIDFGDELTSVGVQHF